MEEVIVAEADAIFQLGLVGPTEALGLADIEELAGSTVRTGGVPLDLSLVADDLGDKFGKGLDGELLACASIDGLVTRVVVHEEHTEVGEVIDIEELTQG